MLNKFLQLVEVRCITRDIGIPFDVTYKEHYDKEENEPSNYCQYRYSSRGEERFDDVESVDVMCRNFEILLSRSDVSFEDCRSDVSFEDCYRFLIEIPDYYLKCMLNQVDGFCVSPSVTRWIYLVFIDHFRRVMSKNLWDDYATYKLSEIISDHKTYIKCIDEWINYCEEES